MNDTIARKASCGHEGHCENTFGRGGRNVPAQDLRGLRSLQGEQGAVLENGQRAIRQLGGNMSKVGSFGSGVDDEKEPLAPGFVIEPRHHQIVENMPMAIEQLRIAHPPWRKGGDIARHERFQAARGMRSRENGLAHVRNIEQARALVRVKRCSLTMPEGYCTGMA